MISRHLLLNTYYMPDTKYVVVIFTNLNDLFNPKRQMLLSHLTEKGAELRIRRRDNFPISHNECQNRHLNSTCVPWKCSLLQLYHAAFSCRVRYWQAVHVRDSCIWRAKSRKADLADPDPGLGVHLEQKHFKQSCQDPGELPRSHRD